MEEVQLISLTHGCDCNDVSRLFGVVNELSLGCSDELIIKGLRLYVGAVLDLMVLLEVLQLDLLIQVFPDPEEH